MRNFQERLNEMPQRLIAEELLHNQGLGNEIGFYIFDYPPEQEAQVNEFLQMTLANIHKKRPELKICHVHLLELFKGYLESRSLWKKAVQLQKQKGDEAVLKALRGPLNIDRITEYFVTHYPPERQDLIVMSGVGSVYPFIRAHTLLNRFHAPLGHTPLILFYPGEYDQQSLKLFNLIPSDNYYRAFKLVPSVTP
jgi:hypothetical protein